MRFVIPEGEVCVTERGLYWMVTATCRAEGTTAALLHRARIWAICAGERRLDAAAAGLKAGMAAGRGGEVFFGAGQRAADGNSL